MGEGAVLPVAKNKALRAVDLLVRDVELRHVHNLVPLVLQGLYLLVERIARLFGPQVALTCVIERLQPSVDAPYLSMGPTRDAEFAAEFLEDGLADVDALAHLEEGHLKVLGELLESEFLLACGDNATRR